MQTGRLLVAIVALFVAVACQRGVPGGSAAPQGALRVIEPANGATVSSSVLTVRGTAPAGARVVRDISFGSDDETVAGADGAWDMQVELDPGENVLTFRVGDDDDTERSISVTFAESACAEAFAEAAAVDKMNDSVEDLYPAVRVCSLDEWRAEFERHGGLRFSGTADSVLGNMCVADEIADTALCRAVP